MGTLGYSYRLPFALDPLLTALLFNAGKSLLGVYPGRTSVTSNDGAAGSLVIVLSCRRYLPQAFFFGVRINQIHSNRYGSHLQPTRDAEAVTLQEGVSKQPQPVV